jgi:hypothetical protein
VEVTRTWAARIREARKRGRFTFEDWCLAADWSACAIGERARWPADDLKGRPDHMGDALTFMGSEFSGAVLSHRIDEADRLLRSIHRVMRGEDP